MKEIAVTAELTTGTFATFVFRPPSKREMRLFYKKRYRVKDGTLRNHSGPARQAFFDKLLLRIEGLCVEGTAITVQEKYKIPVKMKQEMIFLMLEDLTRSSWLEV